MSPSTMKTIVLQANRALLGVLCAAVVTLPAPAPAIAAERVRGIDVSRFQGRINWEQVATDDVNFAFVQASRGSGSDCTVVADRCGPDEFYERNYTRARKEGIPVGPYHRTFAGGEGPTGVRADARKEANVFLERVGELRPGDLRPVLDMESPFNDLGEADLRRWIRTWLVKVEKELGVQPLIYTNVSSWNATGNTTRFAAQGYVLWVANFDVAKPLVPAANWNGVGWSIWQYTSSGQVDGISGNVDLDYARVPLDSLTVGGVASPR
ncbi:MAG: glycoside hydrolase family 25 protein [Solirubrobacterales bacterium]